MRVLPAVDIRGGRCVNLVQGDYGQETVFAEDPVDQVRQWHALGAELVHIVDLDGAKQGHPCALPQLDKVANAGIPFQIGGGVRNMNALNALVDTGAERVIIGTAALRDPEFLAEAVQKHGGKVAIAIDAKGGRVAVAAWEEMSDTGAVPFAEQVTEAGAARIIYTDILSDGMLQGPNIDTTRAVAQSVNIPVTASGGMSSIDDIHAVSKLEPFGVDEVIIGRALYVHAFTLPEAIATAQGAVWTKPYETAVIIGTGLLGASLGLALKQRTLANTVIGTGRRQSSLDTALERNAIDRGSLEVAPVVQDADLIVICTPAASVPDMLDTVRDAAPAGAIVTDVTSTKREICDHAARTWDAPRRFIGSHPMAGSENFGPEYADANLYESRQVLVETGPGLDENARESVCNLWRSVGATITSIDPAEHDRILARTSHVPHIAAAAVALLSAGEADVGALSGGGFRDITRVAAGRPELWRDICLTNADAVKSAIAELVETLELFGAAIDQNDAAALEALLEEGRQARLDAIGDDA